MEVPQPEEAPTPAVPEPSVVPDPKPPETIPEPDAPREDPIEPPPAPETEEAAAGLALLVVDRPLQLGLVHLRPTLDAELPGLVVELVARPAARAAGARPLASATPR
jgi:hypothetical protein